MNPETFFRKTRLKERLEEECDNYVRPIYERYWKEVSKKRSGGLEGYEVCGTHVRIEYYDYETDSIYIPIGFFIDFDAELKRLKEQEEAEAEKSRKMEEENNKIFEEKERKQYELLKKKYECGEN